MFSLRFPDFPYVKLPIITDLNWKNFFTHTSDRDGFKEDVERYQKSFVACFIVVLS